MINWKVRIKNVHFWDTFIPAVIIAIQMIAAIFGYQIDLSELSGKIVAAIDAVFAVLVIMGVVNDPTTKGLSDSKQALTYEKPREDNAE
jgi:phi LC3 family holin